LSVESIFGGGDVPLEIGDARPEDLPAIEAIFRSWTPNHWDWPSAKRYYHQFFLDECRCSDDEVFVGEADGTVVGVTGYCADRLEVRDIYRLGWFYVQKGTRRQGYGECLLKFVIEKLKTQSAQKLYVDTSSEKLYKGAIGLYQKMGFREEGRVRDYYGEGEDKIIMGRII
jgi:ribosomal protein S18 acetylase RimI-like enzyme